MPVPGRARVRKLSALITSSGSRGSRPGGSTAAPATRKTLVTGYVAVLRAELIGKACARPAQNASRPSASQSPGVGCRLRAAVAATNAATIAVAATQRRVDRGYRDTVDLRRCVSNQK